MNLLDRNICVIAFELVRHAKLDAVAMVDLHFG